MQPLFDSHCHLDLPELAPDWQRYWTEAQAHGVQACLLPAVAAAHWPLLLMMCQQQPSFFAAMGIHPWWAATANSAELTQLECLLQQREPNSKICAVGEIGLDFALDPATFVIQQQLFSAQLSIAKRQHLPVILHHRKSQPQLLAELKRQQFSEGGILHAFAGSYAQAKAFIDLGFKLGIGGTITYERAIKTRNTVKKLPLSAIVIETDAPAMPLAGFQGQNNVPAQLARVFACLQTLRVESASQLQHALWENTVTALRLGAVSLATEPVVL